MNPKRYEVQFTKFVNKQISKLPKFIYDTVSLWQRTVEELGLPETRKFKGYHDEPLKGARSGRRSVRLNRSYRLIYEELEHGEVVIVGVLEVNRHEY